MQYGKSDRKWTQPQLVFIIVIFILIKFELFHWSDARHEMRDTLKHHLKKRCAGIVVRKKEFTTFVDYKF